MKKYFILLWAVAQALCADATNFEQLHRSFKETLPRNIDSAHAMAGKMLALAKKENALKWQAQALLDQGLAFSYMGNMLQAISKTREALGISEKNKDQDMVMQACFDLGIYYMQINNYDRSVDYTQRALKIAGYQGDKRKQSYLQANLGTAYSELGDYERSTAYYQQAQKNNGCGNDRFFCARLYLGMARNYRQTKTYGKAILCATHALETYQQEGDKRGMANACKAMGEISMDKADVDTAGKYLQEALKLATETGDAMEIGKLNLLLGTLALREKNYPEAQTQALTAAARARETGDMMTIRDAYALNYRILLERHQDREAELYKKMYEIIRDSLEREEQALAEMRAKLDHDLKRQEEIIALKKKEITLKEEQRKKQERLPLYYFIGAVALALIITFIVVQRGKSRKVY